MLTRSGFRRCRQDYFMLPARGGQGVGVGEGETICEEYARGWGRKEWMAKGFDNRQVVVGEGEVRLAQGHERRRWDELMAEHPYPEFRQFAGRG